MPHVLQKHLIKAIEAFSYSDLVQKFNFPKIHDSGKASHLNNSLDSKQKPQYVIQQIYHSIVAATMRIRGTNYSHSIPRKKINRMGV